MWVLVLQGLILEKKERKRQSTIWVVTHHQYGISALVVQTSFHVETRDGIAKCWLFFQARFIGA